MISDIWQEAASDCLIPESRKTNEVSPMISLAFCLDALSEAQNKESHCKQRANKGARQRKNSRNQDGGRAFGWLIIHLYMVKFHKDKQKTAREW